MAAAAMDASLSNDELYGDMHRLILQGMMSAGYLDAKGVKSLFAYACISLRATGNTVERTTMPYVQKVVREINDRITRFDMAIRSMSDELTGKKYYVFLISVEKPIMQHQTMFSKSELKLFHRIMDTCLRKYSTFSVPLIECQNMAVELRLKKFNVSQAEEIIHKMITLLYLGRLVTKRPAPTKKGGDKAKDGKDKPEESEKEEFEVTVGIRAIREFEPILRETYGNTLASCVLCKNVMLHGYVCSNCKVDVHSACFQKYVMSSKNCVNPDCRALWKEKEMLVRTRDVIGGGNGDEGPSSPIAGPSGSTAAAGSQQQKSPESRSSTGSESSESSEEREDVMPLLETQAKKGKGKKTPSLLINSRRAPIIRERRRESGEQKRSSATSTEEEEKSAEESTE